jgi:hypothetical protein
VFGAALEQFDELLNAAAAVGPGVSPIPLYYALTQAGRAIAAARLPGADWEASGHGATPRFASDVLGEATLEPHVGQSNQFSAFCAAIGSSRLDSSATLGAAWAAIPQLQVVPGLGEGELRPLTLNGRGSEAAGFFSAFIEGEFAEGLPNDLDGARDLLRERLAVYPTAAIEDLLVIDAQSSVGTGTGRKVEIEWRSTDGAVRSIELFASGLGPANSGSYLWPALGATRRVLRPLALWWLVLLGLSSVARYAPDRWLRALDRDTSVMAIPIEEALGIAAEMLPWLLFDALTGVEAGADSSEAEGRTSGS